MARTESAAMMGFLTDGLPKLSTGARRFVRTHPAAARMAVAVALETAAAQSEAEAGDSGEAVPEQLREFVVDRAADGILGVTEAAEKLGISRTTVYDWASKNMLIAWRSTKRKLNIPAAQILGPGGVLPGMAEVVDVVGDPELAWTFLTQEWPFEETVERPLDRLRAGRIEEVLSAAAGFGTSFT